MDPGTASQFWTRQLEFSTSHLSTICPHYQVNIHCKPEDISVLSGIWAYAMMTALAVRYVRYKFSNWTVKWTKKPKQLDIHNTKATRIWYVFRHQIKKTAYSMHPIYDIQNNKNKCVCLVMQNEARYDKWALDTAVLQEEQPSIIIATIMHVQLLPYRLLVHKHSNAVGSTFGQWLQMIVRHVESGQVH